MIGNIYKITPHNCEEFYIGSTWDMIQRERTHRQYSKNSTAKVYIKIRECGGFQMELLYEYECENKRELYMEEQRCMDKMKPTLNSQRAFRSEEDRILYTIQYNDQNRDVLNEKQLQYAEKNKDVLNEKKKQYYEKNKDVLLDKANKYNEKNKDVIREKYQKNRDVILEKQRQKYQQNKQKITCECGCVIVKQALKQHQQSKKHINLMEQQHSIMSKNN